MDKKNIYETDAVRGFVATMSHLSMAWAILALCLTTTPASAARVSLDLREQKAAVQSAPRKLMKAAAAPKSGVLRQGRLAAGATKVAPLNVGDTLGLQLFEGAEVELTLKEQTDGSMGGRSFLAEANGYAGVKNAVVVETADGLQMDIQDYKTGKVYTVYSGASGVVVQELAPVRGQTVPTAEPPPPEMLLSMGEAEVTGLSSSNAPGDTRLDILVAFDANARSYAELQGGGMTNFAQVAVQKMNAALANTGLSELFRFRLVGVMAVDATERDVHEALYAISAGEGGWAAIAEKREEVGADLVTTLIDTGSACGCVGVGWSLSDGMDPAIFANSAYNVCAIQSVAQSHTMTHECGHNLGAGHSECQMTEPGPQLYDYSAGYYFTVDGTSYHTIMAYDDDGHGNTYTAVPYFSSPDYTYLGVPVGDAKHDNTRTLRNTFAAASAWRDQVVPMTYDVSFSPASGATFEESVSVTLTAEKPDAVIRYTTDGSVPMVDSPVYSRPIVLTATTTIRAIAVEDGVGGVPFEAKYWKADLGVAVGAPELKWKTSTEHPWQVQTDTTLDGLAVSGTAGSWLSATIEGPASISFQEWMTWFGDSHSEVSITIDGALVYASAGYGFGYGLQAYDIPEGSHEIRFACDQGRWLIDQLEIRHSRRPTCKSFTCSNGLEKKVVLSHDNPQSTILFTLDGSDPTAETAIKYAGPFFVSESVTVRAVAYEPGRGPSVEAIFAVNLPHSGQHAIRAGVWTPDATCALESAKRDGRLVVVYYGNHETCGFSREFEYYAEDEEFLSWAAVNGIYLIADDSSRYADCADADALFWRLIGLTDATSIGTPSLAVTTPNDLYHPLDGHVGSTFHSIRELAAYFAPFLGGGELFESPRVVSPATPPEVYPFEVTLANPNGTGDIYFTLDGSAPTRENGTKYEGPVTIFAAGTTLKAVVWDRASGGVSGLPLVVTYGTPEGGGDDEPEVSAPQGVTGAYVESNGPLLRWESVEGAVCYRIYAAEIDDFSSAVLLDESKLPQFWDYAAVSENQYYWVTAVGEKETAPSISVLIEGIKPCVEFDLGEHGVWETGIPMKKRVSVAFGQSAVAPAMHAGPGWRFVGWSEDVSCVRSNLSVVARYEPSAIAPFTSDVVADWYVDQTNGSDENRGDSYETPFASIQRAVGAASEGETIIVNDGVYAPVDASNTSVEIRSLHGWPKTVIDGGKTNRCAKFEAWSASVKNSLVGFTLRNGFAEIGGGVYGGRMVSDCLIIDNVTTGGGGGAIESSLERCIVTGNKTLIYGSGGVGCGRLNGCVIHGNSAGGSGGGVGNCVLTSCVIVDNFSGLDEGAAYRCRINDCIIYGNKGGITTFRSDCRYVCTDDAQLTGIGMLYADPGFVDAEQGDFRLRLDSPCIDAGFDYPAAYGLTDLAGGVRVMGRSIDIGAYESEGMPKNPLVRSAGTLFVDAANGSDTNNDGDEAHPFRTIQKAIEASVEGDEIIVSDGIYAPICTFGRLLDIRSVNGASRTIIDGGGITGCARLETDEYQMYLSSHDSKLTGFTLRNGFAEEGGGSLGGTLDACVLRENCAQQGGAAFVSVLKNSLIVSNWADFGGGSSSSTLLCCTVVGNEDAGNGGGCYSDTLYNCIVWNNTCAFQVDWNTDCSNVNCKCYYTCTAPLQDEVGNICVDPLFVDAAHGDYRLRADSPCINAGDNSAVIGSVDLLGNRRIAGGRVDLGAFEYQAPGIHFNPNGGTGVMKEQPITGASVAALSPCTLTRTGYTFAGWSTSPKGEVVYTDGAPVDGLPTEPGAVFVLYAQWTRLKANAYAISFNANGGTGVMEPLMCEPGRVYKLPKCGFAKPEGKTRFVGWAGSNGRRYDDEMLVFNLAQPGETVKMTAIWE